MIFEASADEAARLRQQRALAERILDYVDPLRTGDRALLRAIYDRGMTASDFARAVGQRPRTVRRRVQRLLERIGSDHFQFVLRQRQDWPSTRRRVAELVFLQGASQRQTAASTGLSLHQIRQEIARIRFLIDHGLQRRGPTGALDAQHPR